MTEPARSLTEPAAPPRIWDSRDVAAPEAFDYYREGICACFMPLRPELPRAARAGFRSVVRSHAMPGGALNVVSARSHAVHRTRIEIAASPEPCVYVNLQLDGICTIRQHDSALALHPGELGLFDSDTAFALDHGRRPGLRVASLLLPRAQVGAALPRGPRRLSDHPVYGALLIETARALAEAAERQVPVAGLHAVLVQLIALASGEAAPADTGRSLRIRAAIRAHAARPGWSLGDCAAELGLSERSIQRLLAAEDDGFAAALTRERLARAARLLRDPAQAQRPVADIALAVGYGDPAPFARAFRAAYGVAPGAWRRGEG